MYIKYIYIHKHKQNFNKISPEATKTILLN